MKPFAALPGPALLAACMILAAPARAQTYSGLDVLEGQDFGPLAGRRVAVVTNHTGVDRAGRGIVDVLFAAKRLKLVAIFSPEHGFRGDASDGEAVGNATDPVTGLPVYSLYGRTRRPTEEMLKGVDAIVFDIQDVGARFYTYLTTMGYCMEEAAKRGLEFFVLDRPNPLGGAVLEGPVLEGPYDFTGYYPVPVRHGMTAGEMARLHADRRSLGLRLTVVPARGWTRGSLYDATGLRWVNPSPNIRDLDAALLYPGIGCFEATNVSVGRGTDSPFHWFGAPWMDGERLADALNRAGLEGVHFLSEERTPSESLYKGKLCRGVRIVIDDRSRVRALDIFVHAVCALRGSKGFEVRARDLASMTGQNLFRAVFESRQPAERILSDWAASWRSFEQARAPYLLY